MEEVDAAGRVGKVSLCADIDPPGTIPGNDLDLLPLLQGKSLAEEAEGLQAVAFMDPYYPVTVHVIYNSDVGEPFSVTCLIYAYAAETVHPCSYIGFYPVMGSFDTVSNCPPVNVFEQGDSRSGHPADHPGDLIAEVRGKTAPAIRPRNIFRPYAVFGTFNPFRLVADINRNAIEIRGAPGGFCTVFCIVSRAFLFTDRAEFLNSFIRPGMNVDPGLLKSLTKSMDCDCCSFTVGDMHTIMVEIEDSFQYTKG
jgi:hypothetical protein